jgi:hypothetical protein
MPTLVANATVPPVVLGHPTPEDDEHQPDSNESRAEEDVGSRSIGRENGGAIHDGLAGCDPDDGRDCYEYRDEENYRGERASANSRSLAT